jgi:Na+/H+ antiporter NhaD/arsenite permease-like protein
MKKNGHSMTENTVKSDDMRVIWAILGIVIMYVVALVAGYPQHATQLAISNHAEHTAEDHAGDEQANVESVPKAPPIWTIAPFVMLLGAIAVFPLLHLTEHWWESNLHRLYVAAGLALVALAYYAFLHRSPVDIHWPAHDIEPVAESAYQPGFVKAVLANAILSEYIPFIVLLFSLYTIAGGIRIAGDLRADSLTNAAIIGTGGILASFIGTTGAAMLLIRLLLETNSERKYVAHTVVFFIFVVCNCGGCLLPIGDPPLFLGYLQGVAFTWTLGLWPSWLFVNGLLLIVYLVMDRFYFYAKETISDVERDIERTHRLRVAGLKLNGLLLVGVVLAVALLDPNKAIPGTNWHAWMYLREIVQLALVAISLYLGHRSVREENNFSYGAIIEVAALFIGIFICMQPALQILGENGSYIASKLSPDGYFWASGALSSFLDNAPTYLVFFKTAQVPGVGGPTAGVPEAILVAISLGSVFMGANTYIGNGPNFMVKAIAEKSGVKMPSFFGYMGYSMLILLPILLFNQWQNFEHRPLLPQKTAPPAVAAPAE